MGSSRSVIRFARIHGAGVSRPFFCDCEGGVYGSFCNFGCLWCLLDFVQVMIRYLITLILLFLAGAAMAAPPVDWYNTNGYVKPTREDSCTAYAAYLGGQNGFDGSGSVIQPDGVYKCRLTQRNTSTNQVVSYLDIAIQTVKRCPDGTLPDTSKAWEQQCPEQCPKDDPAGDQKYTNGWGTGPEPNSPIAVDYGTAYGKNFCGGDKCMITPDSSGEDPQCYRSQDPGANGYYEIYCIYPFKKTGMTCIPGPSTPELGSAGPEPSTPNPGVNSCPPGTVNGGVDSAGIPICIGDAPPSPPTQPTHTNTTKTTNPDGSTTTTTTTTKTNADGSTTITTDVVTTQPDGSSTGTTTKETSSTPAGAPGKEDKPDSDLCKQNPHLNICKNSMYTGTCASISCNGDAINCGILREQAIRNCKLKEDEEALKDSSVYQLGKSLLDGVDPAGTTLPTVQNASIVDLSAHNLDDSGFAGGGSCFNDKTFSYMGQSLTIPFSSVCSYLLPFRAVIMLIAAMVAYRMLSGTIIRET